MKDTLTKRDLNHYREILEAEQARVSRSLKRRTKDIETAAEEAGSASGRAHSNHMADQGSDESQYETMLQMAASEREYLREIEAALERIEDGTYGICELTGKPIGRARLEAIPTARFCIEAQEKLEARRMRRGA